MLLWLAALLTLITGYDYLRAGLTHMGASAQAPAAAREAAAPRLTPALAAPGDGA